MSHSWLLFNLRDVGVDGNVSYITAGLLNCRVQRVVVDSVISEKVRIISVVLQVSVHGPFLFLLYTIDMLLILENQ